MWKFYLGIYNWAKDNLQEGEMVKENREAWVKWQEYNLVVGQENELMCLGQFNLHG